MYLYIYITLDMMNWSKLYLESRLGDIQRTRRAAQEGQDPFEAWSKEAKSGGTSPQKTWMKFGV